MSHEEVDLLVSELLSRTASATESERYAHIGSRSLQIWNHHGGGNWFLLGGYSHRTKVKKIKRKGKFPVWIDLQSLTQITGEYTFALQWYKDFLDFILTKDGIENLKKKTMRIKSRSDDPSRLTFNCVILLINYLYPLSTISLVQTSRDSQSIAVAYTSLHSPLLHCTVKVQDVVLKYCYTKDAVHVRVWTYGGP